MHEITAAPSSIYHLRKPWNTYLSCQRFIPKTFCGIQQISLRKVIHSRLVDLCSTTKIYPLFWFGNNSWDHKDKYYCINSLRELSYETCVNFWKQVSLGHLDGSYVHLICLFNLHLALAWVGTCSLIINYGHGCLFIIFRENVCGYLIVCNWTSIGSMIHHN